MVFLPCSAEVPDDEWNLLYVAVTRAKTTLIITRTIRRILTMAGVRHDHTMPLSYVSSSSFSLFKPLKNILLVLWSQKKLHQHEVTAVLSCHCKDVMACKGEVVGWCLTHSWLRSQLIETNFFSTSIIFRFHFLYISADVVFSVFVLG